MSERTGEYVRELGKRVAKEKEWPNDACRQAAMFFTSTSKMYSEQLGTQPAPFNSTQEDVDRWEDEFENYIITLEETANVCGWSPVGVYRDDVDWEVVGEYLLAISEADQ